MKKILTMFLILLVIAVLISGVIPHDETYWEQSCGFSFAVNDSVCKPVLYTWTKAGWLVQLVRGW